MSQGKYSKNRYSGKNQKKIVAIGIAFALVVIVALGIYFVSYSLENRISPISSDTDGISLRRSQSGTKGAASLEGGGAKAAGNAAVSSGQSEAGAADDRVYIAGKWYRPKKDISTTLLIGTDEFGAIRDNDAYNNTSQADFILLLAKDEKTGDTFAIQINRDTMTPVQTLTVSGDVAGREDMQIALSHAYGSGKEDSCLNTVQAAQYFLYNIPIDNYIAMSMDGVAIMNDAVGGVTLKSLEDIDALGVKKDEVITLKDDQALTYVRTRDINEDDSNIKRQNRQRQYVLAWADLAKDKFKDAKAATELINKLSPYLITDCDAMKLADMAQELSEYETAPIYVPEGTLTKGYEWMEFYADEEKLKEMVMELFYEEVEEDN